MKRPTLNFSKSIFLGSVLLIVCSVLILNTSFTKTTPTTYPDCRIAIKIPNYSKMSCNRDYRSHYDNGNVYETGRFAGTKRVGRWMSYNPDGTNRSLGRYARGTKIGIWTYWDIKGNYDRREEYPRFAITQEIPLETKMIEAIASSNSDDPMVLAVCAAYCMEYDLRKGGTFENWTQALALVNKSLTMKKQFWNLLIRARIMEHINNDEARAAANDAINQGMIELPEFIETEAYRSLKALADFDGC